MKQEWAVGLTTRTQNMASQLFKMILLCTVGLAMTNQTWAQTPMMNGYQPPEQILLPTWQEFQDPNNWNHLPLGTGQPVAMSYNPDVIPPGALPPHRQPMGPGPQPGYSYFQGSTVTSVAAQYDQNDPWEQPSEFEKFLAAVAQNSWFRADYLFWSMDGPGNTVVGHDRFDDVYDADVTSDPRTPVVYADDLNFVSANLLPFGILTDEVITPLATSRALDLESVSFREKSGFRGTLGVPVVTGEVQISSFIVGQASDDVYGNDTDVELAQLLDVPTIDLGYQDYYRLPKYYNLPVTLNGGNWIPIGPELVYEDMRVRMTNNVWGGDMKYLIDLPQTPQYGLVTRPLVGAMYLAIHEDITTDATRTNQYGVWTGFSNPTGELHMSQDSYNNIYGATLGVNLEYRTPYAVFGLEPKGLIGFNTYRTRVKTQDLAFAGENYFVKQTKTEFSPLVDLQLYARINLTEQFSCFIGYDLKYAMKVARPGNQTRYNVIGTTDGSTGMTEVDATDFSISSNLDEFKIDGLTIGGEFRFH
ncbi:MAG: BBP7 family outer membrane beta-barrel protein [Planctomycetaceae bacterium]|nr:BBP7 family outer membrane beta-barrel protein [Planctomycetaceae bacterium]